MVRIGGVCEVVIPAPAGIAVETGCARPVYSRHGGREGGQESFGRAAVLSEGAEEFGHSRHLVFNEAEAAVGNDLLVAVW